VAFFYTADNAHAQNGTYFKSMAAIKQKCKQFYYNWTKYNQGYLDVNPNSFARPTVLVVADEVFQMADKLLRQPAKSAIPNTLAECNLLDGRHRNLEF
jgi:hypothetical protein